MVRQKGQIHKPILVQWSKCYDRDVQEALAESFSYMESTEHFLHLGVC